MQPPVAQHMGHETESLEYFCEGKVADVEPAGVGAERGHHQPLAVASKAASLHRPAAGGNPRLGMQMPGDFAGSTSRLMAKHDAANGNLAGDRAAKIIRQRRIVIARDPDPV